MEASGSARRDQEVAGTSRVAQYTARSGEESGRVERAGEETEWPGRRVPVGGWRSRRNLQRQMRDIDKLSFMEPAVRTAQKREVCVSVARGRKEKE